MKKKVLILGLLIVVLLTVSGCEQSMTKRYGGSMKIELEPGVKLEEITWKGSNLWYLCRPMRDDELPETHTFQENSTMGIMEGTVTIIEKEKSK